jgi:hypothetical protein
MGVFLGTVVVVVDVGNVVVVLAPVVVVTGMVVVVVVVVVVDVGNVVVVLAAVVVVTGTVVVVVVVVTGAHAFAMVVVVVDANAGSSCADVVVDIVRMSTKERVTETSEQRRSQWFERRVTQRMYNASGSTPRTGERCCLAGLDARAIARDFDRFNRQKIDVEFDWFHNAIGNRSTVCLLLTRSANRNLINR